MIVDIKKREYSIIWNGTYYFTLSDYPNISDWELKRIILFVEYEKAHGRITEFRCEMKQIEDLINYALSNKEKYLLAEPPYKVTECMACKQKGCITKFLCHTASIEDSISIFQIGSLLSAVESRQKPAEELRKNDRNAAKDPDDYFNYIMFAWGNCQAGDRLVMERLLGRSPNEEDLSKGFKPGIRFYFEYKKLKNHNDATFDGYHPLKIRNKLDLLDNLYVAVIPDEYRDIIEPIIPISLSDKVIFIKNDCKDIWDWSEKVYTYVEDI